MHVAQRVDHFEFDGDVVLDNQVGGIVADDCVIVEGHDALLLDAATPSSDFRISWAGGVLVGLFHESATERIGNPKSTCEATGRNNRASPLSLSIPLIRLKKPAVASVTTPDGGANVLPYHVTIPSIWAFPAVQIIFPEICVHLCSLSMTYSAARMSVPRWRDGGPSDASWAGVKMAGTRRP